MVRSTKGYDKFNCSGFRKWLRNMCSINSSKPCKITGNDQHQKGDLTKRTIRMHNKSTTTIPPHSVSIIHLQLHSKEDRLNRHSKDGHPPTLEVETDGKSAESMNIASPLNAVSSSERLLLPIANETDEEIIVKKYKRFGQSMYYKLTPKSLQHLQRRRQHLLHHQMIMPHQIRTLHLIQSMEEIKIMDPSNYRKPSLIVPTKNISQRLQQKKETSSY